MLQRIQFTQSGFEAARRGNGFGGLLKSFGPALRARAELSQKIERVYSGRVTVTPSEMKCIVPDRSDADPFHTGGNHSVHDLALPRNLIHAVCTGTVLSQVPRWIGSKMAVIPGDVGLTRAHSLDERRDQLCCPHRVFLYHTSRQSAAGSRQ
jgi:hypothetical protein